MRLRHIFLVIFAFSLSGCASIYTNSTGFIDPEYTNGVYQASKIILRIKNATLEETKVAEQKLFEKLSAHNVEVIKFTDIAPPTRTYTPREIVKLLAISGADSIFTIYVKKGSLRGYRPPTYHEGITKATVQTVGNTAYINTYNTPGYISGGYYYTELTMACLSTLVDLRNGKEIYRAESQSFGGSSYADLLVSIGKYVIADMKEKDLLPEKNTKP